MRATALAWVGLLGAAGCGLVYSYDGYEGAAAGSGGAAAHGNGGGTAGTGATGGAGGHGAAAGGTAGMGGTGGTAGGGGGGCVGASTCMPGVDAHVWTASGNVLGSGGACGTTSATLYDKATIDSLKTVSTCAFTCSAVGVQCQSAVVCSGNADCQSQPTIDEFANNTLCVAIGGGLMVACTAATVTTLGGNCVVGSMITTPALSTLERGGCIQPTAGCDAWAGACVADSDDCVLASGSPGGQCPAPYTHEKWFYQAVQDNRCSAVTCAPPECAQDGPDNGPRLWDQLGCQTGGSRVIPATGICVGNPLTTRSMSLPYHPTCAAPPNPIGAPGDATGSGLMRWCCQTP